MPFCYGGSSAAELHGAKTDLSAQVFIFVPYIKHEFLFGTNSSLSQKTLLYFSARTDQI
jgi:hypothetical protein